MLNFGDVYALEHLRIMGSWESYVPQSYPWTGASSWVGRYDEDFTSGKCSCQNCIVNTAIIGKLPNIRTFFIGSSEDEHSLYIIPGIKGKRSGE